MTTSKWLPLNWAGRHDKAADDSSVKKNESGEVDRLLAFVYFIFIRCALCLLLIGRSSSKKERLFSSLYGWPVSYTMCSTYSVLIEIGLQCWRSKKNFLHCLKKSSLRQKQLISVGCRVDQFSECKIILKITICSWKEGNRFFRSFCSTSPNTGNTRTVSVHFEFSNAHSTFSSDDRCN